jgi:hypothetical protein
MQGGENRVKGPHERPPFLHRAVSR